MVASRLQASSPLLSGVWSTAILATNMCTMNDFVLQDWEIWRQYTTYFLDPPPSTDEIATSLVENGTVICARTVGRTLSWEEEGQIETEETSIQAQPDGRHSWKLRTDRKMSAFIVECLHQSAWFEASESKVLVAPDQFPASYVRGFVGEFRFEGSGHLFSIYPVIKMYTEGLTISRVLFGGSRHACAEYTRGQELSFRSSRCDCARYTQR